MKIFLSWSKNKSKLLAEATKEFLTNVLGNSVEFFFSPEMYKGTRVDNEIHKNLVSCDKCIVCITAENYKNPWLLYEAGVVFGTNHNKTTDGIVIPLLFDHIPDWSSWIDKPLNQYVPIQLKDYQGDFNSGKLSFIQFIQQLHLDSQTKNFESNWQIYTQKISDILKKEQLIPSECQDLVNMILEKDNNVFTITSPEITNNHVIFHKGFATNELTKILLNNVINYQGKRLWVYGRRNKRLLSSDNEYFFDFLSKEGLDNGVDFRCLFPYPETEAVNKVTTPKKERSFKTDLQTYIENAVYLQYKFNLPIDKLFRLYKERRTKSIIVSDSALLHRDIICDSDGYPLPYTNSEFEILSINEAHGLNNKGNKLYKEFQDIWDKAEPLTEEKYNEIYPN